MTTGGAGSRRHQRGRGVAVVCLALLVAGGCGSRRSQEDLAAGAGATLAAGANALSPGAAQDVEAAEPAVSTDVAAPVAGGTGAVPPAGSGAGGHSGASDAAREGRSVAAASTGGPKAAARTAASTPTPGAPTAGGSKAAAGTAASTPGPGTPVPGGPAPRAGGPKPVVRIGAVGTISGPIGDTLKGNVVAVQVWAKWVNTKGGLGGHPVSVSVVDDGSDPARHRAALQDLVEKRGVIAFVGNISVFGMQQGSIDYLTQKRVPVVGGDRLNETWYSSPMLFPQASAGTAVLWTQMVDVAQTFGPGTKIGFISCQEIQMCRDALANWPGYAQRNGLEPVYRAQVSLTQPNFTAECLAAQRAGVKVLQVGMDNNSTRRVAASCAQQGYKPVISLVQTSVDMPDEPGLDQALFTSEVFPWVAEDTEAAKEFHAVMRQFAPNVPPSFDLASGWVAAKLFEKAAARLGDNPAASDVLEGLWSLQGDNLGGLTGPLTFAREQKASPVFCHWVMRIEGKQWVAPQGSTPVCRPRP